MALAENLQERRESRGMTQQVLAEKIGVTQMAVSFFESGKKIPSVAVLEKMADALGCSIDWLLGRKITKETK